MAYQGRKIVVSGEVFSASDMNSTIDQTVMVFAGTAARSSAIATAVEGMVTYLSDNNQIAAATSSTVWQGVNYRTINTTAAAAYTATIADANALIYATGTPTVTVPDVFQIGQGFEIIRDGGTVTIAAGTGVTSWAGAGTAGTAVTFKIDQQYNGAQIIKVAANSYRVIGRIA
jgi:hypothetical protein